MRDFTGYRHGLNLGGWLSQADGTTEEYFNTFITGDDIRTIAGMGMDHVRLPVDYNWIETEEGAPIEAGLRHIDDCVSWCEKRGFADYICPQIYFSPDNPAKGFEEALDEWEALDLSDGVRLYVGLAGYKAGSEEDAGTWLGKTDVLATELNILRKKNKVKGFMLYGYASLHDEQAQAEMENFLRALQ